jgi:transaldolase
MKTLQDLKIKLFADGAERASMLETYALPYIKGLTTNPTLMKKAGVADYCAFAQDVLSVIKDKPISFEVFSDDFGEMERQAHLIASWGHNVYVKIPITNTMGEPSFPLLTRLASHGVQVNVTALLTLDQVRDACNAMESSIGGYISVFAGRIADTGCDPVPVMAEALKLLSPYPHLELIWASPRELLNIFQADSIGCHIITATNDILKKLSLVGKDLREYSLDTVKMFYNDAKQAGYQLYSGSQEG